MNVNEQANFVWSIADLLRGDFKQSEYGKVILPFTVMRRFDCVLAPSKETIIELNQTLSVSNKTPIFKKYTGHDYYNISKFDFEKLTDDSTSIETNLRDYINGFSDDVKEIMDNFEIFSIIEKLSKAGLLYLIVQKFAEINMSADAIDNLEMGYMFEELIRKFSEQSNETAGEHFTPREVIELMVEILFDPDMGEISTTDGKIYTLLDPACGTGGMLSVAQNTMWELNTTMKVIPFGQELNPETYATCKSDMILKGNNNSRIVLGNSFNEDGFKEQKFDYMLSNPPFGVEWKKVEKFIKDEANNLGFGGRFGAGTPRISDGSLLFLQHMISKMNAPKDGGSRIAIVFNGSPLFTGDAGSGESEIRRWIIENDMLEAIIALPDQLFYNTGISTYIWVLTNRKEERRKGKIRLVNGVSYFEKMRKSLGNKRNLISESNRNEIVRLYSTIEPDENYIDFDNEDFGYRKITVERPAYDKNGKAITDKKGDKKADTALRDTETVPLKEDIHKYFIREVLPHVPNAWIDEDKTKIGYEIPFTRYFYKFTPLRDSSEIMAEIKALEERIAKNLAEVLAE
ncbi:MAG: class I SAM-dependent DNA methyltransferase [Christensenellaceae bacterium]